MPPQRKQRKKEKSELIDTVDGNPIFTEDDIEDTRITKLLQQRQNYDQEEQDIFLTDLLDADSDDNEDEDLPESAQNESQSPSSTKPKTKSKFKDTSHINDDEEHKAMLEDIFGSESMHKRPTIMGSQLDHDPLDIATNATDLKYLLRKNKRKKDLKLSQELDELEDETLQNQRVTLSEMVKNLDNTHLSMAKSVRKQIDQFDDNQELERLKLKAQTKITPLNLNVCSIVHSPSHQILHFIECKDD